MDIENPIDEYISKYSKNIQLIMNKLRETILLAEPKLEEAIKWKMPTFILFGNVVHFAGFKNHIGFYPNDTGITAFKDELVNYKSTKGAIQFPYDKPIPFNLITEIVKFRVNENREIASKNTKNE